MKFSLFPLHARKIIGNTFKSYIDTHTDLHTENVAGGQTESFQNVGGEGVCDVLTL